MSLSLLQGLLAKNNEGQGGNYFSSPILLTFKSHYFPNLDFLNPSFNLNPLYPFIPVTTNEVC